MTEQQQPSTAPGVADGGLAMEGAAQCVVQSGLVDNLKGRLVQYYLWGFPQMGTPQSGWFVMEKSGESY